MNRLYLEKLVVSGGGHKPSVIEFCEGLNFILGPSNTGKSLVMDCIDYVFGAKPRKDHPSRIVDNNFGYEKIALHLQTMYGRVSLERMIGDSEVTVYSRDNLSKAYKGSFSVNRTELKNINDVYLHLIGIDGPHKIRTSERCTRTNLLTWRSLLHLFFIKQADVARETSSLLSPTGFAKTFSAGVLLFLLTGKDDNSLAEDEDPTISEAKKDALITYMHGKIDSLGRHKEVLAQSISAIQIDDTRLSIDRVRDAIDSLQNKINEATKESKRIMSEIYAWNGKLSECTTLRHNFEILGGQYKSDIERIEFLVDGAGLVDGEQGVRCPFCGENTHRPYDMAFIDASNSELEKIKGRVAELNIVMENLDDKEAKITEKIRALEKYRTSIDKSITEELQPQLEHLRERLDKYLQLSRLQNEMDFVNRADRMYRQELFEKETEETRERVNRNIFSEYDSKIVGDFEEVLKRILRESNIGNAETARLNMDNFDVEVGGQKKSVSMGGGFCGILNTITTMAMSEYLMMLGSPVPSFYAVDSSLTQLSEAHHIPQMSNIKQNFIKYLIRNAWTHQVIIVEQDERMPFLPCSDRKQGINVVQFTQDKSQGRYGFLNDVYHTLS